MAADNALGYDTVILDIEGTTTSISFVADVLFPYIKRELRNYLTKNWGTQELSEDVALIKKSTVTFSSI